MATNTIMSPSCFNCRNFIAIEDVVEKFYKMNDQLKLVSTDDEANAIRIKFVEKVLIPNNIIRGCCKMYVMTTFDSTIHSS